jgi:hypothetical protein
VYGTVNKKADLLKAFNDYERLKYKLLEDKMRGVSPLDKKTYNIPNFNSRDLEI